MEDAGGVLMHLSDAVMLRSTQHFVQLGMETGAVIHFESVGQFMQQDKPLQVAGQQQSEQREMNVVGRLMVRQRLPGFEM